MAASTSRFNLRSVLDRVDVMGYGPTHPRVAVVVVGEDSDQVISSVESVFSNTDLNRIFVICAVFDGQDEDPEIVKELNKIDDGSKYLLFIWVL
jgi:nitrate reductase NapAB chaperone NapD